MKIILRSFAVLLAFVFFGPLPASAESNVNLYRLLGGSDAVQDFHHKIGQIVANIREALRAVLGDADELIQERLDQLDNIIDDALTEVSALPADMETRALNVLAEAEASLTRLEAQVFRDVNDSISRIECAGQVFTVQTIQEGMGDLGDFLGAGVIEIRPPLGVDPTWWERFTGSSICGRGKSDLTSSPSR